MESEEDERRRCRERRRAGRETKRESNSSSVEDSEEEESSDSDEEMGVDPSPGERAGRDFSDDEGEGDSTTSRRRVSGDRERES